MNITSFLRHWKLTENPFRDEEALHDAVFARLASGGTFHPDFEKILGDLEAPATSIVFGEKGSGKTAIRMQLTDRIKRHNAASATTKIFLIPYDELNPVLDRFAERMGLAPGGDGAEAVKKLKKFSLVDHMDAMLHMAVVSIVDAALEAPSRFDTPTTVQEGDVRALRRAAAETRRDLCVLASIYDSGPMARERAKSLRRRLRVGIGRKRFIWRSLALLGWTPAAGVLFAYTQLGSDDGQRLWIYGFAAALTAWIVVLGKVLGWDKLAERRLAGRVARELRVTPRGADALADAFGQVPRETLDASTLPLTRHEETRYALFTRLHRVLASMNFHASVVLIDRVDEPALIGGDGERMRAVVWPLMNNKFLQMPHLAVKALLPIELRHELFRESASFFQGARLDKQNLVERLNWTGAMLYDLCNARLNACRSLAENGGSPPEDTGNPPLSLASLFAEDVSRQDVVDALDQMHQPRDAFKLMYQCIAEHCSNVTEEQASWRVPRLTLDAVRRQQADRVQMFYRGIRPA